MKSLFTPLTLLALLGIGLIPVGLSLSEAPLSAGGEQLDSSVVRGVAEDPPILVGLVLFAIIALATLGAAIIGRGRVKVRRRPSAEKGTGSTADVPDAALPQLRS